MIPHWAPTILDGHAHYGRPRKPSRLIMVYFVHTAMACLGTLADQVAEGIGPTASPILLADVYMVRLRSNLPFPHDDTTIITDKHMSKPRRRREPSCLTCTCHAIYMNSLETQRLTGRLVLTDSYVHKSYVRLQSVLTSCGP